jgi:hypothetical protein
LGVDQKVFGDENNQAPSRKRNADADSRQGKIHGLSEATSFVPIFRFFHSHPTGFLKKVLEQFV